MAISLDSIYNPVNEFFLNIYRTDTDSPIVFKFDKFGSSADFTDPDNPSTGIALERFSDLVNRLPVEQDDGINILFSADPLDDAYFYRILNASIPFASSSDPNKEETINAVTKMIADAKKEFEKSSLARSGMPSLFRPSYANPEQWCVQDNTQCWSNHQYEAMERTESLTEGKVERRLWKLEVRDTALQKMLPTETVELLKPRAVTPDDLQITQAFAKLRRPISIAPVSHISPITRIAPAVVARANLKPAYGDNSQPEPMAVRPRMDAEQPQIAEYVAPPNDDDGSHTTGIINLRHTIRFLNVEQRYSLNQFIKTQAPAAPTTTDKIKICFDYCKVDIRRPWLFTTFFKNKSWFLPNTKKGELTTAEAGSTISLLPIGFVAIKNLTIEANWSDLDRQNSKTATDFGPFEVSSEIVNNTLSHQGIQIVGWVFEKLPDLPPLDPPVLPPA